MSNSNMFNFLLKWFFGDKDTKSDSYDRNGRFTYFRFMHFHHLVTMVLNKQHYGVLAVTEFPHDWDLGVRVPRIMTSQQAVGIWFAYGKLAGKITNSFRKLLPLVFLPSRPTLEFEIPRISVALPCLLVFCNARCIHYLDTLPPACLIGFKSCEVFSYRPAWSLDYIGNWDG